MAIDTHIKFDGVEGESTHADHKGEIEVLSWSWGLSSTATPGGGGGSGAGKTLPKELRVVHRYDKASLMLAKNAASGRHVISAMLSARKAGEGQKDFLKITMKEVFITSVSVSDSDLSDGPTEEVALSYSQIDFAYQPQDSKGGLGPAVKFDWNIKTGQVS